MGTVNGAEVLSRVSGLSQEEVKRIWSEVRENQKRLDDCIGPHEFSKLDDKIDGEFLCSKCGGKIRGHDFSWYQKGLEHGKMQV